MSEPNHDSAAARTQCFALRGVQQYGAAADLCAGATARFPNDPALAFGLAQTRYELGYPAADLFARAQMLAPGNLDITRNHALALISERQIEPARALLAAQLAARPDWLAGHKLLATLNWTSGDRAHFSDHLATACRAQPGNAALWLAWFSNLAQTRDWPGALAVLAEAERHLGAVAAIQVSRLLVAVESGPSAEWSTSQTA